MVFCIARSTNNTLTLPQCSVEGFKGICCHDRLQVVRHGSGRQHSIRCEDLNTSFICLVVSRIFLSNINILLTVCSLLHRDIIASHQILNVLYIDTETPDQSKLWVVKQLQLLSKILQSPIKRLALGGYKTLLVCKLHFLMRVG